ncbi:3-phosphoglycerate dehydrogenase [Anaerocolumna sedimenticola]|uniref:3-phosphoglycerate dehydrogenase n=1 Tax=Anaerocolumna sedimenticola TaxID=2696063 RepID=A0A6P1TP40_9FIRM|nr:hydroxyacid dehydrogenase [Anaerocolumna sedimenticola]QHQ61576.1 3-phosphoglycerate dehydrogenase [Anaerocolumna sedimenticola]
MGYKILITEPIDKKGIEYLKEEGYELKMGSGITEEILMEEGADCDGILTRNGNITEKVLTSCKKLKVVAMHGVGVDCIDVDAATRLGIQVTNAASSNQSSVAEYTIGLILMLAKKSIHYNNGLKSGNLEVRKLYGSDVSGKTLGIIGMGNIGTQVAKIAAFGLNMHVIGYNRRIKGKKQTDYALLTDDMDEVISSADFLSLHLPGSISTKHIIGERELSLMKPEAYLINTGRGEIINESALINVLKEHKIMGAALDVFEGNLPKPDNPLLHMEHVIVTPHTAAFTTEALERMAYQAALGITEVLEKRPVSYPVNKIKDSFEENKGITAVMNYYRYEFGNKY